MQKSQPKLCKFLSLLRCVHFLGHITIVSGLPAKFNGGIANKLPYIAFEKAAFDVGNLGDPDFRPIETSSHFLIPFCLEGKIKFLQSKKYRCSHD